MDLITHKIMSNKVVLGDRTTKKFSLPESKAEVEIYASIIAQDLGGFDVKKIQEGDNVGDAVRLLSRLIKSWNIYESDDAKEPREINIDSINLLPIKDLNFLFKELKSFIVNEKKE